MPQILRELDDIALYGHCDPSFEPVLEAFEKNFVERRELGASLCLTVGGETVVDIWGGFASANKQDAWQEDTVSVVFSCTKAATALCAHLLIDRGQLALQAPVGDYWPEFACNGKEGVTVEMMLNHSSAVPAVRETLPEDAFYNWDLMTEKLAEQAPFWVPGTRNGYHMITFGWTVGELVRRVTGKSLGQFFRQEIAEPFGLDFWIGIPEAEHHRIVPMLHWLPGKKEKVTPFTQALMSSKASLQYLAFLNSGKHRTDQPKAYVAEIGGGGGIGNGRSLAGLFAPLANQGEWQGKQLVSKTAIETMSRVSVATMEDATLLMPTRFGLGFMRSMDNRHRETGHMETVIMGRNAFGHAGAGGSLGFADPECGLSFGYSMNRMGAGILVNDRGQALVDAAYQCLGYSSNHSGDWVK